VLLLQEAYQRSNLVPEVPRDAPVPRVVGSLEKPAEALDLVGVARACGLAAAYVPSARNGPESVGALGENKGNAILSSLPLGDVVAVELHGWGQGASVVGGDFNTWSSRNAALKAMLQAFPDSPPITTETSSGPFPADHIFFRADPKEPFLLVPSSYRTVPTFHDSDHIARILQLSVR
jgi:hypothetical protein